MYAALLEAVGANLGLGGRKLQVEAPGVRNRSL